MRAGRIPRGILENGWAQAPGDSSTHDWSRHTGVPEIPLGNPPRLPHGCTLPLQRAVPRSGACTPIALSPHHRSMILKELVHTSCRLGCLEGNPGPDPLLPAALRSKGVSWVAVPVISLMEALSVSTGAGGKADRERWEPQIWTQSGREGAGRCKSMPGLAQDLGVLVPWTVGGPAPAQVPPEHSCRQDCLGPWCLRALLCGEDLGDRVGLTPGLYVCPFSNLKCHVLVSLMSVEEHGCG